MATMNGQMTIFDFLKPTYPDDLNTLPEEEMVRIVGEALGIKFNYDDFFESYKYKKGIVTLTIGYSNYSLPDNTARFIGCGYDWALANDRQGGGRPCDSIEEAVNYLQRHRREDG